ncbi:sensor histidine kinase [Neotabrizicola shimadae]|nr:histidine kinase [Neotabrizicola shimadae]
MRRVALSPKQSPGGVASPRDSVFGARQKIMAGGLFAVLDFVTRYTVYQDLKVTLALTAVLTPLVLALAIFVAAIYERKGFAGRFTPVAVAWVLGLSLASALLLVATSLLLRIGFGGPMPGRSGAEDAAIAGFYYFMVIGGWSLICFWIAAERARRQEELRAAQAEAAALRLDLQRLRLQLNPHFLVNTLNGISQEIASDPKAAQAVLIDLSHFLRHALEGVDRLVSTVNDEVESLEAYLALHRLRFGQRLTAAIEVDSDALGCHIASFLLQPLVENAIEHGTAAPNAEVQVDLRRSGASLAVTVRNRGSLDPAQARHGSRIGLSNVARRLELHYPGRHRFALLEEQGYVVASLVLEGEPCSAP